jgi:hypothetical protein
VSALVSLLVTAVVITIEMESRRIMALVGGGSIPTYPRGGKHVLERERKKKPASGGVERN